MKEESDTTPILFIMVHTETASGVKHVLANVK